MSALGDDVRAAIEAGDPERVRDLVVAAKETERRAIRKSVDDGWWFQHGSPKRRARVLARLGTATARQVVTDWWSVGFELRGDGDRDLAYTALAARGRDFFATVARGLVSDGIQQGALLVRRAVQEGLLDALPDEEAYIRALVFQAGDWTERDSTYKRLRNDAQLREEVWRFFEVDCSTELSRADIWEPVEERVELGPRIERMEGNRWIDVFTRAAAGGLLDRDRLLDASLDALVRDFRPSMVGWYAKLHEALAPTAEERRERLDRYLALVASPVPSVVKEGLVGLRALDGEVPADELARAAVAPLTQKQKNLAAAALGLLERAAREPTSREAVLEAAAHALGHERADVQERALKLLERYPDEAPRAALLAFADTVSPTLRARVEALTGVAVPVASAPAEPAGPVEAPTDERLEPVASLDELIELASSLLEGQGSGDDVERFLDGVSRLCDERPRGFDRRTAGLLKQAGERLDWVWLSGVGLVQVVARSWLLGRRPYSTQLPDTLLGFLGHRAYEVAARAAKRRARPLLAFPTHAGGRIEADVLAERERRAGRVVNRPDPADRFQARLRALHDTTPILFTPSAVERRGWPLRLLHLEPAGIPDELGPLATAVAKVGRNHESSIWLDPVTWAAWDALGARWCLTVLPAHPEVAFAGAARLIVDRIDASPQLHPEVALEHALDPRVPLGEVAWLAVAGGLAAKSPDLQRVATDVVVASVGDGRFDADGLAGALAWLLEERLAKASRLEAPLRDIGRVSTRHAAEVARLAEAFLARLNVTPHGLQAPLEAVLEHAAGAGLAVRRPDAREALERIAGEVSRGSKLGRVSRALLELR